MLTKNRPGGPGFLAVGFDNRETGINRGKGSLTEVAWAFVKASLGKRLIAGVDERE